MKVAVITDTHAGIRNDSPVFYDYFKKSYDWFFDTLEDQRITHIIHLGDVFDRRKFINIQTANRNRLDFLDRLNMYETVIIQGNHDEYYKNTGMVNSLQELIGDRYRNISILPQIMNYTVDGVKILLVPWINDANKEGSLKVIESSDALVCMGHLDLHGFEEQKGSFSDHGLEASLFKHFRDVYSGHFHHRSKRDNVTYIGAFCEHTWADWNDDKGFSIFDTSDLSMTFYKNPYSIFKMFEYDEEKTLPNIEGIANTFTRIVVSNKTDPIKFDGFMNEVAKHNPYDVSVIEQSIMQSVQTPEGETILNVDDTLKITQDYIENSLDTHLDKKILSAYLTDIFREAQMMETL